MILPADKYGPAASAAGRAGDGRRVGLGPLPQPAGRPPGRPRRARLDRRRGRQALRRQGVRRPVSDEQKHAICDDVCFTGSAKPEFRKAAHFFSRFRSLCAGAYYATPAGWHAIGYVGNAPLTRFDGPPASVLKKLGVTQTVKDPDDEDDKN